MAHAFSGKLLCAAFAAVAVLAMAPANADAAPLRVALDQARPLALKAPASGVVVGNPSIAGVSMQSDRLLFVTGRSYGTTNLIVVGDNGRPVYEGLSTVVAQEGAGVVNVTRGVSTVRQPCTPICRQTPDISDDPSVFDTISKQRDDHAGAAAR